MPRRDQEQIYRGQRAGFIEGMVGRHDATRERSEAVPDHLEAECTKLELHRRSPEF